MCKEKDKLYVEWSLKSANVPIGVSLYEVRNGIPDDILKKLPTEKEINMFIENSSTNT